MLSLKKSMFNEQLAVIITMNKAMQILITNSLQQESQIN